MEDPAGQISPIAYLFAAFTFWMLFDAWKRRAPLHWFFIIVVMPFGAVIYFVMVKLRELRGGAPQQSPRSPEGELPLTSALGVSGAGSELDRADALESAERFAEAEALYRSILEGDDANQRALHGLARCLTGIGRAKEALPHFERLLELDRGYANYGAALEYADALWAADQRSDTIELLQHLAAMTGRLNHRLAYAHYLAEFGRTERAIDELERALEEANGPNNPFTDRHRYWVDMGRRMLEELSAKSPRENETSNDDEE